MRSNLRVGGLYIDSHFDLIYCFLGVVSQRGVKVPCFVVQKLDAGLLCREDYISKEALWTTLTNGNTERVLVITGKYPNLLREYATRVVFSPSECAILRKYVGVQRGTGRGKTNSSSNIGVRLSYFLRLFLDATLDITVEPSGDTFSGTGRVLLATYENEFNAFTVRSCGYNMMSYGLHLHLTVS